MADNQADKAKQILKNNKVTQQDLADLMKKDRTYITRLLSESTLKPELLEAMAKALKWPMSDLVDELEKVGKTEYQVMLENSLKDKEKIIQVQDEQIAYLKAQLAAKNGDKLLN